MPRTKQARKFGGRPVERKPELGKRTHLTIALALPLKRRIEREAVKQGRSISNEAALRLEQSFEIETLLASFGQVVVNVMLKAMEAKGPQRAHPSTSKTSCARWRS